MIELVGNDGLGARIKLIGMGGGGSNAVNTMIAAGLNGVEFVVANTDSQALKSNLAPIRIQLGEKGLGAGADPEVGRLATVEKTDALREQLDGADMVFITAGMGGGTGTGGAPVVGRIAREEGILTVGVVTKPFKFEGPRRTRQAEAGIQEMRDAVDTLIVIPNQRLLAVAGRKTSVLETFRMADDVLLQAVRGIADLITVHGLINLDFADVRTVMSEMGLAIMGSGTATGENRAVEAAQKAISSPLLEGISIKGAKGVLINITGSMDLGLHEVDEAATLVQEQADEDANIIFGAVIDENMGEEIRITVIATGFGQPAKAEPAPPEEEKVEPLRAAIAAKVAAPPPPAQQVRSSNGPLFGFRPRPFKSWIKPSPDRPVVKVGVIIDENGEPRLHRSEPEAPPALEPEPIDPDFVLGEDGEDTTLDTPAFLRKQQAR